MNTKELIAYLEKIFKVPNKRRQRVILGQLQIMINESGIKLAEGQELCVRETIELLASIPRRPREACIEMLVLATYVNSCR